MTRKRPIVLPGSRGPFRGKDGKALAEYEVAERGARAIHENGLLIETQMNGLHTGSLLSMTPATLTTYFYALKPLREASRFSQARIYVTAAGSSCAKTCMYLLSNRNTLKILPNSEAVFCNTSTGLKSVDLNSEVIVEQNRTYFLGFCADGGSYTGYLEHSAAGPVGVSVLPFFSRGGCTLPKTQKLSDCTKVYTTRTTGPVSIAYLTPEGKEIF